MLSELASSQGSLCEQMLGKLLPGVAIRQMVVTSQNRVPLLQNGTVDIECGSTTNNAARQQQVAFANTTYITEARFAVRASRHPVRGAAEGQEQHRQCAQPW